MSPKDFTLGEGCAICAKPLKARGLCATHLQRFYRTGNPFVRRVSRDPGDLATRFWARVLKTESCWIWTGTIMGAGYGQIGNDHRVLYAHRVAYEITHGPIPDGLHIDHLCRVRSCVRPDHLEAVTQAENNRRASRVRGAA